MIARNSYTTARALSIRQPWAWLIVHGYKPVENRPWSTRYRGLLLIHAGLQLDRDGLDLVRRTFPQIAKLLPPPQTIERGGLVGVCTLTDCVTAYPGPWFTGPYGFVLTHARQLPFRRRPGRANGGSERCAVRPRRSSGASCVPLRAGGVATEMGEWRHRPHRMI